MSKAVRACLIVLLSATALAACTQYWRESGLYDLAGEQGLQLDLRDYYHRHAVEEGGRCPRPVIEAVTDSAILEDKPDRLVLDLRYAYRDILNDGDDNCDRRFQPLRCTVMRECEGFSSRTFTIQRGPEGRKIVDMSGPRRR